MYVHFLNIYLCVYEILYIYTFLFTIFAFEPYCFFGIIKTQVCFNYCSYMVKFFNRIRTSCYLDYFKLRVSRYIDYDSVILLLLKHKFQVVFVYCFLYVLVYRKKGLILDVARNSF